MRRDIARLRDFAGDLLKGARAGGGWALALAATGAALEGAGLMLLVPIIGLLSEGAIAQRTAGTRMSGALASYLPAGQVAQLVTMVALFAALMLLRVIVTIARDVHLAQLNSDFVQRTRSEVLARLVAAGWSHTAGLRHGRVSHLLSADFQACGVASTSFINLCLSILMLAVLILVAFILSPAVAATIFILLVILMAVLFPALGSARRTGSALVDVSVRLTSDLGQFLAGLKPTLGNNLGGEFLAHIGALQREQARHNISFARQQSRSRATIMLAGGAVGAIALLAGGLVFGMSAPRLLALLVVLARVSGPALQLQQSLQILLHSLPTYEKVKALEAELGPVAQVAPSEAPLPIGPVALHQVTYLHSGGEEGAGVCALDLTIEPGDFVAIVGPSGAGKTTLADLLAGLVAPQQGTLSAGGEVLTSSNVGQWQSEIAYVPQDSFLLNDTIRANLLWGSAGGGEEEILAALEVAAATALVEAREHGLDTSVGERGILLSGGERQRIALARALLRKPRFVILDEATNALDLETERRVLANLAALPDRPAIVVISHRAAILDLFDRTYRIEGGRLV